MPYQLRNEENQQFYNVFPRLKRYIQCTNISIALLAKYVGMYRGPQLLWYTLRSDVFSVYRTYCSELLNETLTSKSASVRASL